jgi:putative addiction module component (TIGR02574 family)
MTSLQQILKLSTAERLLLIEKIWDSIDPETLPVPESHKEEIDRRLERLKKGKAKFYSWNEVKKRLHSKK